VLYFYNKGGDYSTGGFSFSLLIFGGFIAESFSLSLIFLAVLGGEIVLQFTGYSIFSSLFALIIFSVFGIWG